jgi:hypothetical protein
MSLTGRKKSPDGTEAATGVDMVQPAIQASVVAGNAVSGSEFALGTVGELRDRLIQYCIKTKRPYELYLPQALPVHVLKTHLDKLDSGDSWFLGTFGALRAYAQKGEGFYSTESEDKPVLEDLCEFVTKDLKQPKVLTLHFATKKTDAIVEAWCKKNNVKLNRMYEDPNLKKDSPTPTPASMTLPKR